MLDQEQKRKIKELLEEGIPKHLQGSMHALGAPAYSDRQVMVDMIEEIVCPKGKPKIITLCGSTRFIEHFAVMGWELEKQGAIALSCHYLPKSYFINKDISVCDHLAEVEGVKEHFDQLHMRKIEMSDEILVLNVEGYIGESTNNEIAHAKKLGKLIRYLEPMDE